MIQSFLTLDSMDRSHLPTNLPANKSCLRGINRMADPVDQVVFFFLSLQSALARQSLYVKFDPLVKGSGSQSPGDQYLI